MLATTSSALLAFVLKEIIQRMHPFPLVQNATWLIQSTNEDSYQTVMYYFFVVFFGFLSLSGMDTFYGTFTHDRYCYLRNAQCSNRAVTDISWRTLGKRCLGGYIIGTTWLFILILAYQWVIMHINI